MTYNEQMDWLEARGGTVARYKLDGGIHVVVDIRGVAALGIVKEEDADDESEIRAVEIAVIRELTLKLRRS